jgi:hypothetical protein
MSRDDRRRRKPMLRPAIVAVPLMLLVSVSARAGERIVIDHGPRPSVFKSDVRVNVSVNFFVPAPLDDSEASMKAQAHARRMLYESAGKECDLLRATIASECRLEAINVSMRMTPGYGQQQPRLNASGNFNYRINLK